MFENIFNKKSEGSPTEVEIRSQFEEKELALEKEAVSVLERLGPEKLGSKSASLLLASVLTFNSLSAFAAEQGVEDADTKETTISQVEEKQNTKNQTAFFDWRNLVEKMDKTVLSDNESTKDFDTKVVYNGDALSNFSGFYSELTNQEVGRAYSINGETISTAQSASEFFENLTASTEGFSDKQKAVVLQRLGMLLAGTYNYDMAESDEHVVVSDDAMFAALRAEYLGTYGSEAGICGNIHTFLVKVAHSMGVEAWLQSGSTSTAEHIWAGLVVGEGDEKEIVFLDYGNLIPTGTLDYQDALGIAERYHGNISLFNNYVGNENEILFPVKSRAAEVAEKASGVKDPGEMLGESLENGEIRKRSTGIELAFSPETEEIKLNTEYLGLSVFKYRDANNNPYQALRDVEAMQINAGIQNKNFELRGSATILNMNMKDINDGTVSLDDIVTTISGSYVDKKSMTKSEYGEFAMSWGATFSGAIRFPVSERGENKKTGMFEEALGGRVIYINPSNTGSFYVEAIEQARVQGGDFQAQEGVVNIISEKLTLGASVKVLEGKILTMSAGKSNNDWGDKVGGSIGIESGKLKGKLTYEKNSSDYERFVPSSEKIEIGVSYHNGPQWEVDVIGAKTTEKYKDAKSEDTYTGEVKLRIFLW